jgi:hypothetical protein
VGRVWHNAYSSVREERSLYHLVRCLAGYPLRSAVELTQQQRERQKTEPSSWIPQLVPDGSLAPAARAEPVARPTSRLATRRPGLPPSLHVEIVPAKAGHPSTLRRRGSKTHAECPIPAACESLEHSLELGRANHTSRCLDPYTVAALAEARLRMADDRRARESAEEAIRIALRTDCPVGEVQAQLAGARVLLALDGTEARRHIESGLDRAEKVVGTTGACSYTPQILVARARFARLVSAAARQHELLVEAQSLFRELAAAGHAERTAVLLTEASV